VQDITNLQGLVDIAPFRQVTDDTLVEWGVDLTRNLLNFSGLRNGNFMVAIPHFLGLLKKLEQRHFDATQKALIREVEALELELSRFKETLKEDL